MKATELTGKEAIRTKPCDMKNERFDYSYCAEAIKIIKATETHIFYQNTGIDKKIFGDRIHILDHRWCDDNWIEYEYPVIESQPVEEGQSQP
jgi:hypothetical protein